MLLVLGAHRSGTSVVARMLECLGARPSDRLHEPLPNNPKGFFEDLDVERFDEYELLPALGARWHDVVPPDWSRLDPRAREELAARAREIVCRNFRTDAPLSVLKEPRICVLLPFWLEVLESIGYDVRFVCAVRDPLSVARSLRARDGFSLPHGAMVYASNWIAAHRSMGDRPSAYVEFEDVLSDPAASLARVAHALELKVPPDFSDRIGHARATFLDVGLCHSSATTRDLDHEPDLPKLAAMVFDALEAAAHGGAGGSGAARRAFSALQSHLEPVLPLLRAHDRLFVEHSDLRRLHADLSDELAGVRSMVPAAGEARVRTKELESQLASAVSEASRLSLQCAELVARESDLRELAQIRMQEAVEDRERLAAEAARDHAIADELRVEVRRLERSMAEIRESLLWRMTSRWRRTKGWLLSDARRHRRDVRAIRGSDLFDAVFYALQLPPSDRQGIDPAAHYLEIGASKGLRPSPFFDGRHYLESYPDIREAGVDPLLHFIRAGRTEGRKSHADDTDHVSVERDETTPAREMREIRASGAFDAAYYLDANPDVRSDGIDPITHYVLHGWREGRNPSAAFDTRFYLREHLHDDCTGECPLAHYVRKGRHERLPISEAYLSEAVRQRWERKSRGTVGRMRRASELVRESIGQQGGVMPASRRAFELLRNNGARGVLRGIREQLRGAERTLTSRSSMPPVEEARSASGDGGVASAAAEPIPPSCRVLFIGCDGHLAGSQVLLLNLLRWLRAHSAVDVGTILLGGGELVEQYEACGPVVVWPDLVRRLPDVTARREHLERVFGPIDLIYGNTVLAATIYADLESLDVPILSHVHELEKSIRAYVRPEVLARLRERTARFVACSAPVADNLSVNHAVGSERIRTIEAFIPARRGGGAPDRPAARVALGIPEDARTVVGCGTIYWRKGVDLFVDTAIRMKELGAPVPDFIWIGAHHWENDPQSRELMRWRTIEERISANGLDGRIRFVGALADPRAYFEAADVFFLPSREDPFPLVCLEAAQAGTPVVCFDGAGGMPGFVKDDAGIVVPFLDVDAAAAAIHELLEDADRREELGRSAARKVERLHVDEVAMPAILGEIHQVAGTAPLVSVIVPVYNQESFLDERMRSILGQTFRDYEIIVLDDASTDGSLRIAQRYAHLPNVRVVASEANSGSAFRQWARGIELARGQFVWIAEGDDSSAPDFLRSVLPSLADPRVVLAYADSRVVDEDGRPLEGYRAYYDALDPAHWKMHHQVSAEAEINFGLGVKNTIPNVSAVVFRRSAVGSDLLDRISAMRFAGDWMFYVQLAKGRQIAFRCLPLNVHRKHSKTLTHRFNSDPVRTQSLLDEVRMVHEWVLRNYPLTRTFRRRLEEYLAVQIDALFPGAVGAGDDARYPLAGMLAEADAAVSRSESARRRVVFVTTNDHSHDGGSEQLWIHAALAMAKAGHAVMAVIRRWTPEPYFLGHFRAAGIEIAFKDASPELEVRRFAPELVVINIGDQDDGVDWYELCRAEGLPYAIVNHLTKEPRYWPIRPALQDRVREGNLGAELVLFTSRNNRALMERRLGCAIPQGGIFHNPLFLDRSRSLPFPNTEGPIRVAMPARLLDVHKGQRIAIEVFSMPKWRGRPIELHLYGTGPDERALRELALVGKSEKVFFHQPRWELPHPDMEGIWRECHALLMSSYMEGMPLVLLNAMFYGRVPIVTDIGGHREVVEDGVSGFIASEPTVAAVDDALERAWGQVGRWGDVGCRAREAMLRFAPEDPVADFVEKLVVAIAARRARGVEP